MLLLPDRTEMLMLTNVDTKYSCYEMFITKCLLRNVLVKLSQGHNDVILCTGIKAATLQLLT